MKACITQKNVNIEFLRVISMFMILTLHVFTHGQVLSLTEPSSLSYYIVWIIEGICYISVNIYMLISGYFLSTKPFSWKRVVSLYSVVLFYSIFISMVAYLTGIVEFSLKSLLLVFPIVGGGSNWFVTVYFAVILMSPLLNVIVNNLSKELFRRVLIILFVLFSVFPTIFYWVDQFCINDGYSVLWYCYLYLVAAYTRKYEVQIKKIYSVLMIFSIVFLPIAKFIFKSTQLQNAADSMYSYNSVPVFLASLSVFIIFINKDNKKHWCDNIIFFLGKTSFGVFYIHTFVLIKYSLWVSLGSKEFIGKWFHVFYLFACVVLVYLLFGVVDFLRSLIFKYIGMDTLISRISYKLDDRFNLT